MCTVTLSYDQNNALARRKLAALLKTGLFEELSNTKRATDKEKAKHVEEVESIMNASKKSMSHIIERYLWNPQYSYPLSDDMVTSYNFSKTSYAKCQIIAGYTDRDIIRRLGSIKEEYFNEIIDKVIDSIF